MTNSSISHLRFMTLAWAKKADDAAKDTAPWALGNLRDAQNKEGDYYKKYAAACRLLGLTPDF